MKRPWMPLYVSDFRTDTLDLRTDEIGVYLLLLMLAWLREDGSLPNDMAWLKRSLSSCAANVHGHHFNRVVPKLLERYFVLGVDGNWHNKRLSRELEKAVKRSANGQQMANKRWHRFNGFNGLQDGQAMRLTLTKNLILDSETSKGVAEGKIEASSELETVVKGRGWSK